MHKAIALLIAAGAVVAWAGSSAAADLKATLTGEGSGTATVSVDAAKPEVCYDLKLTGVADPLAAHIHKGAAGASGPVAVPFAPPVNGASKGCAAVAKEVAEDLAANPAGYYVNVHTMANKAGAVRGQLSK